MCQPSHAVGAFVVYTRLRDVLGVGPPFRSVSRIIPWLTRCQMIARALPVSAICGRPPPGPLLTRHRVQHYTADHLSVWVLERPPSATPRQYLLAGPMLERCRRFPRVLWFH